MSKLEIGRRGVVAGGVIAAAVGTAIAQPAAPAIAAIVHLSPGCGCCRQYVEYLKRAGFAVRVESHDDLTPLKRLARVPGDLEACHTTLIEGYSVEGHVPAAAIRRLLADRPKQRGVAVPGMPAGSPGMEGGTPETYTIFLFRDDGARTPWMRFVGQTVV